MDGLQRLGFILMPRPPGFLGEQHLRYQEYHYLMLNKPAGVISATRDRLHPTVLDLLPPEYLHLDLFPVGRLDKDTEGLLLLIDDGILAHRLLAPKRHVPKRYRARVRGCVDEGRPAFCRGTIWDFTTLPAQLDILTAGMNLVELPSMRESNQVKRMSLPGKEVLHLQGLPWEAWPWTRTCPWPGPGATPAEPDLLEEWRQSMSHYYTPDPDLPHETAVLEYTVGAGVCAFSPMPGVFRHKVDYGSNVLIRSPPLTGKVLICRGHGPSASVWWS